MKISFFVPGKAAPGGSKKAFAHAKTGRIVVTDDAKGNRDWKARVADVASRHHSGPLLTGALEVSFAFVQSRPKSHYRTGKNAHLLKPDAPKYPTSKPDALKLARSTEDAITDVIWKDDCTTVDLHISKRFGDRPGVQVTIWSMKD